MNDSRLPMNSLFDTMPNPTDKVIKQATHLWTMLDEMAESDPEGYGKFIRKNITEFKEDIKKTTVDKAETVSGDGGSIRGGRRVIEPIKKGGKSSFLNEGEKSKSKILLSPNNNNSCFTNGSREIKFSDSIEKNNCNGNKIESYPCGDHRPISTELITPQERTASVGSGISLGNEKRNGCFVKWPNYELIRDKEGSEIEYFRLIVSLPGVESARDILVDVSENLATVEVIGLYYLRVNLEESVDDSKCTAQFSKKQGKFLLKIPVKK